MVDIETIQKWLTDNNTYNYKKLNVMKCDDNNHKFITKNNVLEWLSHARTDICVPFHPTHGTNMKPYDALIFYVSCHGDVNQCNYKQKKIYNLCVCVFFFLLSVCFLFFSVA